MSEIEIEKLDSNKFDDMDKDKLSVLKAKANELTAENINELGKTVQDKVSSSADNFISNVRTSNVTELGETLSSMSNEMKKLNVSKLKPQNKFKRILTAISGFNIINNGVVKLFDKYDDISKNINNITSSLKDGQIEAIKDNASLKLMTEETKKNIEDISDEILVAEFKLEELNKELIEMNNHPEKYDDYEFNEKTNFITNLQRRVDDLNITKTVMLQSLNDISIIQQGNVIMVQKISSAINNTLPIWKNTMALGVALARQNMSIEKLNSFTEYSNEMLIKKSEMIKNNAVSIAKANDRQIIDYKTLEKVHTDMIDTLSELDRIQSQGRIEREKNINNIKKLVCKVSEYTINKAKQLDEH